MYIDDMPMWALVGDFGHEHDDKENPTDGMYIWTHKVFEIGYNGNRIVDVNVTTAKRELLRQDMTLHFSYEVGVFVVVEVMTFVFVVLSRSVNLSSSVFVTCVAALLHRTLLFVGNLSESRPYRGCCFVPVAKINAMPAHGGTELPFRR